MASPAAAVFEIVDMDVVHANVDVIESDLSKIRLGDVGWIHVDALDRTLESRITSISPTLDEVSRTAQVEITVGNPEHLLKPGMFAQVTIPTDVRTASILLPRSAVIEAQALTEAAAEPAPYSKMELADESASVEVKGEKYVFVVSSGRSRRVTVECGLTQGNLVEIMDQAFEESLSKMGLVGDSTPIGLDAGVPVIISGQRNLRDGDFVQIVKVIEDLRTPGIGKE
jgi:multidrug efflux pump subunit AcrA (membrane-fusion protein)